MCVYIILHEYIGNKGYYFDYHISESCVAYIFLAKMPLLLSNE